MSGINDNRKQGDYFHTCVTDAPLGEILSSAGQELFRRGIISLEDFTDDEIEDMMEMVYKDLKNKKNG